LLEKVFSDGLACRLPIFLTKEEIFQNYTPVLYFTKDRSTETNEAVNTSYSTCLGQSVSFS
jgi:hypothetical protein